MACWACVSLIRVLNICACVCFPLSVCVVVQTLSEDTSYFLRNFAQGAGSLVMMYHTSPQVQPLGSCSCSGLPSSLDRA